MKIRTYNINEPFPKTSKGKTFPNMTCNRIILYGILNMLYTVGNLNLNSFTIKLCNQYAINVITRKLKAKKNLDILNRIWFQIDRHKLNITFIKVKKE